MGGVLILLVVTATFLVLGTPTRLSMLALLAMLACGILGFIDDWSKVSHERSLGPSPAGQALLAGDRLGDLRAARRQLGATAYVGRRPAHHVQARPRPGVVGVLHRRHRDRRALDLPRVRRRDDRGDEQRSEPDGRTRRSGGGDRCHRHACLRGNRVSSEQPRERTARRVGRRSVRRLPLVQQLSRRHLHGRHGLAGPRCRRSPRWRSSPRPSCCCSSSVASTWPRRSRSCSRSPRSS